MLEGCNVMQTDGSQPNVVRKKRPSCMVGHCFSSWHYAGVLTRDNAVTSPVYCILRLFITLACVSKHVYKGQGVFNSFRILFAC